MPKGKNIFYIQVQCEHLQGSYFNVRGTIFSIDEEYVPTKRYNFSLQIGTIVYSEGTIVHSEGTIVYLEGTFVLFKEVQFLP